MSWGHIYYLVLVNRHIGLLEGGMGIAQDDNGGMVDKQDREENGDE